MPANPQSFAPGSRRLRYIGLQQLAQQDFSAGAFPLNEDIPPNGAEDIVNGFIDDDGSIVRRGGAVYKQTNVGDPNIRALWDGELVGGPVTVMFGANGIYILASDTLEQAVFTGLVFDRAVRPAVLGRMLIVPNGSDTSATNDHFTVYGGATALGSLQSPAGTISLTQGSKTVTGSGTSFVVGGLQPGWILTEGASAGEYRKAVIEKVDSATQLTLTEPWPYGTATALAGWQAYSAQTLWLSFLKPDVRMYAAQIAGRLVVGQGDTIYFSQFLEDSKGVTYSAPFLFGISEADSLTIENRHKLPEGAKLTGLVALRNTMMVFTSAGVWAISGMALELTDAQGNPQQRLDLINRDVILWANGGVVTWRNSLVVPALDDLYLMDTVSQPQPITGGARRLYRSYAKAGYRLGQAAVHRGRYILPIVDASDTMIDELVWRLDAPGIPFTRWDGYGGLNRALLHRTRAGLSPQLLALSGPASAPRVTDLTGAFDPSSAGKNDADGSTHELQVTTRTFSLGDMVARQWRKLRARYELDDASTDNPTVTAEYATNRPGSSFSSLSGSGVEGDQTYTWIFSKRARGIRFRLSSQGPSSLMRLRQLEVFFRPSGRR